ncbi:MAG: hypothetical protein ACLQUZ_08695, partial [Rhizomicrobium sp.]
MNSAFAGGKGASAYIQDVEVRTCIYDLFYLLASRFVKDTARIFADGSGVWSTTDMGEDRRGRISYVIGPDGS